MAHSAFTSTFAASLAWLVASASASASTPATQSVRDACMPDIRTLCASELGSFDRAKVRACLIANIKRTSPACQAAARAQQNANRAQQAPGAAN
jgi:hypothetical protein